MNKTVLMIVGMLASAASMAMSLSEARGKIASVIANPSEATAVMQQLSPADQKSFVAEVNKQLAKLPGSAEERSAKVNDFNRNALMGSAKKNVTTLIAEMFATAPVESLAVINETFAKDVLNRSADPNRTYTDAEFVAIAEKVMSKVNERLAGSEDAGVRGGFAALMMVRASNGSPATLANSLADTLGGDAQVAKSEWFPAALSATPDYSPMLAGASDPDAQIPDVNVVLATSGAQHHIALLSAVMSDSSDALHAGTAGFGDWTQVQSIDNGIYTQARTLEDKPWNPNIPRGYNWQNPGR